MKILLVNSFDKTGGSTVRMRRLYNFLCKLNYNVIYIESNSDLTTPDIISIPQSNTVIGFIIGTVRRMKFAAMLHYDILFIQKLAPFTVPIILIAKLRSKKIIVDFDDWDSMLQKTLIMKYLCSLSENLFFPIPDIYIVPHISLKLLLNMKTNKNVFIIPQGIDTELFSSDKYEKNKIREKIGLLQMSEVVGFVGCFTPGGIGEFENILLGIEKVIAEDSNIYFLVIGGGRLLNYYQKLCAKLNLRNVIFTDRVDYNEVPQYIAACDIMTIWMKDTPGDCFKGTLKIIEYLSMNKLVIGHLVGETKFSFGKYCIQCSSNIDSFYNQLKEGLKRLHVIEKPLAHEFIRRNYSLNAGMDVLDKILKSINMK